MQRRQPWFVGTGLAACRALGLCAVFASCGGKSNAGAVTGPLATNTTSTGGASTANEVSSGIGGSAGTGAAGGTAGTGAVCPTVAGDHGDCDEELGWGFDTTRCRLLSGCDCTPDCDRIYPSAAACAAACSAQGYCNRQALVPTGIARDFAAGSECQSVTACVPEAMLDQLDLPLARPCFESARCPSQLTCPIEASATIDSELWDSLCAASFLPEIEVQCTVVLGG